MKKAKKAIKEITEGTMLASGGSMALGGLGGTIATRGQAGLLNVTRHVPTMGKVMGAGMLVRSIGYLEKATKKRRR